MAGEEPLEYLLQRIREALAADERVGELGIGVELIGTRIYLTGRVAATAQRDAAGALVEELEPKYQVCNEIAVERIVPTSEVERLS